MKTLSQFLIQNLDVQLNLLHVLGELLLKLTFGKQLSWDSKS